MNQAAAPLNGPFGWIVSLLIPLVLILGVVRLLMTSAFLNFEYRTPNFPADSYGFTREDRLHWSEIALDYLLNSEDVSFLGDLRFEDGTPVYNARELRHMVDVKLVVRLILRVWYVAVAALALLGVYAWRTERLLGFLGAVGRGGWLTAALVGLILLFVLVAFGVFFVAFHNVFFEPGTWQFLYSDTLIRLFPERFWRDSFLIVGAVSGGAGLALWYLFGRK